MSIEGGRGLVSTARQPKTVTLFCSTRYENGRIMVDFFSECTSFRYVVLEKDSILDCLGRMKSSRIVVESRITLRCIYFSFFSPPLFPFFPPLRRSLRLLHARALL